MTDIASLGLAIDSSQSASAASNLDAMASSADRAEAGAKRLDAAASKAATSTRNMGQGATMAGQQLQDIAIQLGSGQSSLIVALQQAPQLAYAFGNSLSGAATGIGAAFASMLNPLTLITFGLVAAGGAAIQWLSSAPSDIDKATAALKSHDDVLKTIKEHYPLIKVESDKYLESASRLGLVEQRNSEVLKASADAAMSALVARARQVDTLVSASSGLRAQIASPQDVKAFQDLQGATQEFLRSVAAGNPQIKTYSEAIAAVSRESANPEVKSIAGALSDAAESAAKATFNVGSTKDAIAALGGRISESLPDVKAYAEALTALAAPLQKQLSTLELINQQRAIAMKNASSIGEQQDVETVYQLRLKQLETEKKLVELYGSGGVPTPQAKPNRESIVYSTDTKAQADADRAREQYRRLTETAQSRIDMLKAEQQAIGMTAEESARLRYETELLNRAEVSGMKLKPEQIQNLKDLAAQMAATDAANQRMQENWDAAKGAANGFVSDFVSGLRNGEKAWKSFGDAANGVLDKIINKATDSAIDLLFTNSSSGGGGLGGLLSSLFKFNALGGVYGSQGAMAFANGGAFTNSIVSKPTLFPFANGTGLMGERGPEAIMPLARDSAGRLGVKSSGGGGGVSVSVGGTSLVVQGNVDQSTLPAVKAMLDERDKQLSTRVVAAVRDAQARGKL